MSTPVYIIMLQLSVRFFASSRKGKLMRKVLLGVAVAALLGSVFVGCNGSSGGSDEYSEKPVMEMHPGEKKYDFQQYECPVCGGHALKEELYSEVGDKGRIYFDKEECKKKFDADPQTYIKKYTPVQEQMKSAGPPGKQ